MLLTSRLEGHRRLPPFPLCLPLMKPSPAANATLTAFSAAHAAQKFSQLMRHSAHHTRNRGTNYPFSSTEFNGTQCLRKATQKKQEGRSKSRQPGLHDSLLHSLITADTYMPQHTCFPASPMLFSHEWTSNKGIRERQETPDVQPCMQDS